MVTYNDPHIPTLRTRRLRAYGTLQLDSVPLTSEALAGEDCVVIATDHSEYDYEKIVAASRLVVDTRNATRAIRSGREKIIKA